eukprot:2154891-Amphidinium_carterae.1
MLQSPSVQDLRWRSLAILCNGHDMGIREWGQKVWPSIDHGVAHHGHVVLPSPLQHAHRAL